MDYTLLTQAQKDQISLRKLLDLEAEHFGLEMDVKVALSTGVDNDNVTAAQQQIALLAQQINLMRSWVLPPHSDGEAEVEVSSNGQPVEAR
jgi:hypothetical protein